MQTCITSGGCMSLGPNNGLSWATITLPGWLPQTPSGSPCSGTARSQHSTRSSAPSPSEFSHSQSPCEGLKACIALTAVAWPLALLSRSPLRPWPRHTFLYIPASSLPSALSDLLFQVQTPPHPHLVLPVFVALDPSQATQLFTNCVYSERSVFHPPLESKSFKAEIRVWVFTNEHSTNIC